MVTGTGPAMATGPGGALRTGTATALVPALDFATGTGLAMAAPSTTMKTTTTGRSE